MSRRPRNAEATREAILDSAEHLFIKQGFGSTSMSQIGKRCQCANSLIVHHFGSKEELWSQVKDRAFAGFVEESQRIFRDEVVSVQSLKETTARYFWLLRDNPHLVQLLLRAEIERESASNQMNTRLLEPFLQRMREAQQAGILRDDIPAAHLLLTIVHVVTRWFEAQHLFSDWDQLGGGDADRAFLESVHKILMEGALSSPAKEAQ